MKWQLAPTGKKSITTNFFVMTSVPSKNILHWANVYFNEHEYFKNELAEF